MHCMEIIHLFIYLLTNNNDDDSNNNNDDNNNSNYNELTALNHLPLF